VFRPAGLDRLSLSLGAYAALFVSAGLLVTTGTDPANPVAVVAGLVTLVAVAVYTGRLPAPGERLSASRGHRALLAVPAVIGLGVALQLSVADGFRSAAPPAAFLGFAAILPAVVVYVTAENRRARHLRETDPVVEWTGAPPATAPPASRHVAALLAVRGRTPGRDH